MTKDAEPKQVNGVPEATTIKEDIVLPDFVRKLLETIAGREGFADGYRIVSHSGSNVGDGFIGILLSIVISGSRHGNDNEDLVLVCKIPPVSQFRQKFATNPFKQEIVTYEVFLPELVKFQREKGIDESEGFFAFPKCYGTYADEEKCEFAIVLEDLRQYGFRMWDKYTPIDYKHVKLAFAQLGKFHALSFALRKQRPDIFAKFTAMGSSMFKIIEEVPDSAVFYKKNHERALEALHPEDTKEIRRITHLINDFKTNFRQSVSGAAAEPFAVFCHGDFWNNNMMFQYSSADSSEPLRAVLIDWQISQYCSPATDLTYYLYSSTEQSLRTDHFDDLLHDYHGNLADLLQRLGGNAETQFSFDDLQRQLDTFGIYGLILAPVLIQIVTVKAGDLPDMDSMDNAKDFDFMANGSPSGYNVRVRDVVRDFVARGYFGEKHLALREKEEIQE